MQKFIEKYTLYNKDNYPEKDQIEPVLNQMQCKGCASKIPQSTLDSVFEENTKKGSLDACLLYTSPSPRDLSTSRMPSSA